MTHADPDIQRKRQLKTVLVLGVLLGSLAVVLAPVPAGAAQAPQATNVLVNPSLEGVSDRANGFQIHYDGAALASTALGGTQSVDLAAAGPAQPWSALGNLGVTTYDDVRFRDLENISFSYHAPNPLVGPGSLRFQAYLLLDTDDDGDRDACIIHRLPGSLAQTAGWAPAWLNGQSLGHNGGSGCSGGPDDTPLAQFQADPILGSAHVLSISVQTLLVGGSGTWPAGQPVYVDEFVAAAVAPHAVDRVALSAGVCGGPDLHATIADALVCAAPGATVAIQPGVYEEAVVVDTNRDGDALVGLTVCAAAAGSVACDGDRTTTIVDATGRGGAAFTLQADEVVLQGLTLRGDAPVVTVTETFGVEVRNNHIDELVFHTGASGVVQLLRGDASRIVGNTILMGVNSAAFGGTATGIRALESDHVVVTGNSITGSLHPAETAIRFAPAFGGSDGGAAAVVQDNAIRETKSGIRFDRVDGVIASGNDIARVGIGIDLIGGSAAVVSDNTIRGVETEPAAGFLELGVFLRQGTTDWNLEGNDVSLFPRGVYVGGSAGGPGLIQDNVLHANGLEAIRLEGTKATPDIDVTGNRMHDNLEQAVVLDTNRIGTFRENRMDGGHFALALNMDPARFPDLELDARVNGWGVDNWRLIEERIQKLDTQTVHQLPYLDIEEPGFPVASDHTATAAACAAHADAEWIGNHCRFLTVQAALDFAAPGATVYVPMSAHLEDPTPRFESLDITTNGVTVCASVGGHVCAADAGKGHFQIVDNMDYQEPPVLWSGEAIRLDTGMAPFHGSTSFFPPAGFQLDDVERLSFDWLIESGACGAGSPRVAFWADLDGSGTRDGGETVLAYPDLGPCALDQWQTEDLLDEPAAYFRHPSTGHTDLAGAHGALAALDPAYEVQAINVQYDTAGNVVWFDNALVNDFVLAEELDLSCVLTTEVACRQDFAVAATIIDGSADDTVVRVAADDVTLGGLTLRRTGDQAPGSRVLHMAGVDAPRLIGNDLVIEGGGCLPDQLVAGGCFADPQTTGISGSSTAMVMEDNKVRANLFSDDTNEIGGTNGLLGAHVDALVTGNTFEAWAANAVFATGKDMTVSGNVFRVNRAAVMACSGAHDMRIVGNQFTVQDTALKLCGPSAPMGVEARDNAIGATNLIGFAVDAGIVGASVNAECNDWGVYHDTVIQETRVDDPNVPRNLIDTDPFTGPDVGGVDCLLPPVADFTASTFAPLRGEAVEFTDLSENGSYLRPIASWEWDFGDGATAIGPGVSTPSGSPQEFGTVRHSYRQGGAYDVELRVTDTAGVVSSVVKTIVVENAGPTLEAIADRVIGEAEALVVPLYATDADGDALSFSAFGLPSGASLVPLQFGKAMIQWTPTLTQSGTYSIFVTVTDSVGDFDTRSFEVTVQDTVPVPGFPGLHDSCILEGYPTTTTVQASDVDGDAITLSLASSLPAWATFVDAGDGVGRFHWSPSVGSEGQTYAVSVAASAGGDVSIGTFQVCVKGHPDLVLERLTGPFEQGSPGETLSLKARVENVGRSGAMVEFGITSQKGWDVTPPPAMFVPAGGAAVVTYEVVVGTDADQDRLHFWAEAPAYPGEVEHQYGVVAVPVSFAVSFDEPSTLGGVSGQVFAHFLDGSAAKGVRWTLVQSPDVDLMDHQETSVTATTDAAGLATFDFGADPLSRVPGLHWFDVSGVRVTKTYALDGAFAVDAV